MSELAPSPPPRPAEVGIGVVLLTWFGAPDTLACLDSLAAAQPRPSCVVVVENASTDDSAERVLAWARERGVTTAELQDDEPLPEDAPRPWLVLVRLTRHRGFSGGNNVGLRILERCCALTHFLLLNNDTEVAPDYFAALADAARRAPDAALLGGTIYHYHDRSLVWWAGGVSVPWRALAFHRTVVPSGDEPVPTSLITGCALLISRGAYSVLGPLPECYFPLYVEDAEYSFRAMAHGIAVLYAPRAVIYHKVGGTTKRTATSPKFAFLDTRHRGFYVRRNLRGAQRLAAITYLAVMKPARASVELLRGRPALAAAYLRGLLSGLTSADALGDAVPWRPRAAHPPRSRP
jgi:GT2 family glycosyltransferase